MTASRRRFLLTVWDTTLGAAVHPVAVLAVDTDPARPGHAVVWVPGTWDDADGWRERLAGATTAAIAAALPEWLAQDGGLALAEIDAGPAEVDLRTAAEFALDEVLAVLLPLFTPER
ncbi:hypothetical protein [Actinoplanes sp. G11-F43]|uniref:hypothetical protein n=1 Tax=Actinoplanes sp. G11-F43 TaxID=3424130 RepID=UPI003D347710